MTTSAPLALNPQIIGQAENAHLPILNRALAGTGLTKNQWVTLSLTMAAGGTIDRDQLVGQVTGALKIDDVAARAVIAELTASALLEDPTNEGARVGATDAGKALFHQIRSATSEVVARAYAGIPAEDLATAARVLTIITARLNKELAGA
jgi:DNA-binding MarR family transcriptional regulator